MVKRPRVVTLCYYFPPLVGIASERAFACAESLERFGWDVSVVTVSDGHYHAVYQSQEFEYPVIRTAAIELSRIIRRAYSTAGSGSAGRRLQDGTVKAVPTGSFGARLRRWVHEWVYVPDAQVGWIPFAALATARAAAGQDSVILSTSVPYSAHLAAALVAMLCRIPWIAEFRDPWTSADEAYLPRSSRRRKIDRMLERFILTRSDHIIVTSATTRTHLLNAHPGLDPDHVSVVMNGFVPETGGSRPAPQDPCCFVLTGTVFEGERPDVLLSAFARLNERAPGSFRFRVFGPPEPWTPPSMPAPPWLELRGVVTPAAARQAVLSSTATVLLQHHPARLQILSGKAFEYIGARRPIIAVVPTETEMAEVLRSHADVRLVPAYNVDLLAAELERLVQEHSAGALVRPTVPEDAVEPLSRDGQTRILDEILLELIQR
jgi:hypothetical protein